MQRKVKFFVNYKVNYLITRMNKIWTQQNISHLLNEKSTITKTTSRNDSDSVKYKHVLVKQQKWDSGLNFFSNIWIKSQRMRSFRKENFLIIQLS